MCAGPERPFFFAAGTPREWIQNISPEAGLGNFDRGGSVMKCPKCKSRMYAEKFYDFVRSFDAWKCCSCGEVIDPAILANRARNHNLFLG